ncbi:MAG: GNAT family N-acetyltransferase [Rhizobiales bacterium PAR1]|nr:MAG: GNAT family N-acetyltransferase [Rhizobiales bacterium PAR1]
MAASPAWHIEDGNVAQFPALAELWREAWQVTRPDVDFTARLGFIEGRLADSARGQYRLRVLSRGTEEGAPLGFTLLEPKMALMEQIAVHPEAWGLGAADALLEDANALVGQRLWLTVNQFNARAIRFYERHGFTTTGEDISPSGLPTYVMKLTP